MMLKRRSERLLRRTLEETPAVVLLGPRQVGKTTLARVLAAQIPGADYLDLEDPRDAARMTNPGLCLSSLADRLVILDEVQRAPGLFRVLRGQIDARRRQGRGAGHFLLLGSASGALLRQSPESLAGRVHYEELPGLDLQEVGGRTERLWLRGGFPEAFLARSEAASERWRLALIRTYLERDIPQVGVRVPAATLRRLWTMLAHRQGGQHNAAALGRGLDLSTPTVARITDLLVDLMLVRRLPPYFVNVGKRLVKAPRLFLRDSGLLHTLLGLRRMKDLLSHPVVGASWEGFVIENLIVAAPFGTDAFFYRTRSGAELDLLLLLPDGERWAVEVKLSEAPRVSRGFRVAAADVAAHRRFVVCRGPTAYPISPDITAVPLPALMHRLIDRAN